MSDLRLARLAAMSAGVVLCSGMAFGQTTGPDVIVGDLPDVTNNAASGLYDSVAVGTTSCNKGNTPLNWHTGGTDNRHPAISQNVYRLMNGRFEQLGQGQLKHGFTALQGSTCTSYFGFGCTSNPDGTALGVGCSDPYGSGLNNVLGSGGPKWQVNAATGLFPYPYPSNANAGPPRIRLSDLNAGLAGGARFFIEGQYIVGDDAAANNKNNNASWREISFAATAGTVPNATEFAATLTSGQVVHREQAGIYAWAAADPAVTIATFDVPGDGRFILGSKVTPPAVGGPNVYTYEYALYNMNSHRCAGSFIIPLPATHAALASTGFHDVEIVGEPNALGDPSNPASDDWTLSGAGADSPYVSWAGQSYNGTPPVYTMSATPYQVASFTAGTGNDHTANVIRWGELFNFRFTSEVAPGAGSAAVGLWRPGATSYFTMNVQTPGGSTVGALTGACCNNNACTLIAQAACTSAGGTWGLPGSSCTPNPCVAGSCCLSGVCTSTLLTGCTGTWTSGASCQPNPCPIPTGACCSNNTCAIAQAPSCVGTGFTYQGDGTSCAAVSCPQGNDGCSSAVALCDGVPSNGTTVAATNDGTASCAASGTAPDVWYSYIPATSGSVVVDTCTASYDTAIAVRTGNCPGTAEVGCDDDACGSLHSRVTVTMTAGVPYLIRVSGYNGITGTFSVKVTGGGGQGCNPTGACCTGTACTSTTQSACTGSWQGASVACGPTGNPTTCCPANYNQTGGVTVQDIFDFLTGFFSAAPAADFNHTGGITVQDIFDFLGAWFTGC